MDAPLGQRIYDWSHHNDPIVILPLCIINIIFCIFIFFPLNLLSICCWLSLILPEYKDFHNLPITTKGNMKPYLKFDISVHTKIGLIFVTNALFNQDQSAVSYFAFAAYGGCWPESHFLDWYYMSLVLHRSNVSFQYALGSCYPKCI